MSRSPILGLLGVVVLAAACTTGPGASPTGAGQSPTQSAGASATAGVPDKLVLGLVPSREADVLVENAQPLADYLSEQLGIEVESFVPQDYPGLVTAMRTGQAHIGAFGPFGLIQSVDEAGAEIILQSARDGAVTYHTQWMTNDPETYCMDEVVTDDAGLTYCNGTLDAAEGPVGEDAIALIEEGTTVSFVTETSASGYIFPALQIVQQTWIISPASIRSSPAAIRRRSLPSAMAMLPWASLSMMRGRSSRRVTATTSTTSSCSPTRRRSPTTASPSRATCPMI
jgi:phosphonate transport system substrate-binding protein